MIGIFFLAILGLLFLYEIYIYKYYKKIILKNGEKIKYKLVFIFLFFLPFYDIILGYSKITLNIIQEPIIKVTAAGEIFKKNYILFNEKYNKDEYFIEKEITTNYLDYSILNVDNKNYVVFNQLYYKTIDPDKLEKMKKELLDKYNSLNFVYLSYLKKDNNYFNQFTNEILMTNNLNKKNDPNATYLDEYNEYQASYNNFIMPLHLLGRPVYYEQKTYIYTIQDYFKNKDYINLKHFFILYFFIFLSILIYLILKVRILFIISYISLMLIIPFIFII
jgi:hypothetical protein